MHAGTIAALLLALASTVLVSFAYLREHGAVAELPALTLRHPLRSAGLLLGDRAWLAGFAMEAGGFGLYVAALALAPLALVQSVAAGGIGILAVASARMARRSLTRRELIGSTLAVGGLVCLAVSLSAGNTQSSAPAFVDVALWLGVTTGVAIAVLSGGRPFLSRAVSNGIAGGLFFAMGDISTKLATAGGVEVLYAIPAITSYLVGTSLVQIGYQSGAALTVAGIATLLTNAVPIAAGTVLLQESLPAGLLGVVRVIAFAAVTAGAILLARPPVERPQAPANPDLTRT